MTHQRWKRGMARLLCIAFGTGAMACQPEAPNYAYVTDVVVTPDSAVTYVGGQVQFTATPLGPGGIPLDGRKDVAWYSTNARAATVSRTGVVTAVSPGTAVIAATIESETGGTEVRILPHAASDWSRVTDEWTTHQGNPRHTGYVPATTDPLLFATRWEVEVVQGLGLSAVTEGEGLLFATSTAFRAMQQLWVLDAASGGLQWSRELGDLQEASPPAYGNHAVYAVTSGTTSYLWAFEASTGTPRFQAQGTDWGVAYSPVPDGEAIYMSAAYDGTLFSFKAPDGAERWSNMSAYYNQAVPAVQDGQVYVYSVYGAAKITVSDAATGALLYEITDPGYLSTGWGGRSVPVLGDLNNLVVEQNNRLASFDLGSRSMTWEVAGVGFRDDPSVANGVVYAHTLDEVQARKESDGTLLWSWKLPGSGTPEGPMVVTNNVLFVSGSGWTYALDLSAQAVVWTYPTSGRLALTRSGLLLIARGNGMLTAIGLK